MSNITVGIADDHRLFRKGLRLLVEELDGMRVVLEAETGRELINKLDETTPDVVLMDLNMPDMDGVEATRFIAQHRFLKDMVRIIAISMHDQDNLVLSAIKAGAKGYLLKNASIEEVEDAIYSVMRNNFYFNDLVSTKLLQQLVSSDAVDPQFADVSLSGRETEVIQLICKEYTTVEIAEKLFLSPKTIEGYRKNMMDKVGARNMAGLIVYAVKKGIV